MATPPDSPIRWPPLQDDHSSTVFARLTELASGESRDVLLAELVQNVPADDETPTRGLLIGRRNAHAFPAAMNSRVLSRSHVQLVLDTSGRLYAIDVGSTHGTRVVTSRYHRRTLTPKDPVALSDGDTLIIGKRIPGDDGKTHMPLRVRVNLRYQPKEVVDGVKHVDYAGGDDVHLVARLLEENAHRPRRYGLSPSVLYSESDSISSPSSKWYSDSSVSSDDALSDAEAVEPASPTVLVPSSAPDMRTSSSPAVPLSIPRFTPPLESGEWEVGPASPDSMGVVEQPEPGDDILPPMEDEDEDEDGGEDKDRGPENVLPEDNDGHDSVDSEHYYLHYTSDEENSDCASEDESCGSDKSNDKEDEVASSPVGGELAQEGEEEEEEEGEGEDDDDDEDAEAGRDEQHIHEQHIPDLPDIHDAESVHALETDSSVPEAQEPITECAGSEYALPIELSSLIDSDLQPPKFSTPDCSLPPSPPLSQDGKVPPQDVAILLPDSVADITYSLPSVHERSILGKRLFSETDLEAVESVDVGTNPIELPAPRRRRFENIGLVLGSAAVGAVIGGVGTIAVLLQMAD